MLEGLAVLICGALGWSAVTLGSLKLAAPLPWAAGPFALVTGSLFLWAFWRYLDGKWWPRSTAATRHSNLRANRLPRQIWAWGLLAGVVATISFVALVTVWRRIIPLQPWTLPGVSRFSFLTAICLLLGAAAEAGIIEEAAFRGYMQAPMEKRYGAPAAITVVSIAFGFVHLANGNHELTWLLPYMVFGAILGLLAHLTNSIIPSVLLHSGVDAVRFWLAWHSRPVTPRPLLWQTSPDTALWIDLAVAVVSGLLSVLAFQRLAAVRMELQLSRGSIAKSTE